MTQPRACHDCGQVRRITGRELCNSCYCKRYRLGTLDELPKVNYTFAERLAQIVPDENGCWPWPGWVNEWGYGRAVQGGAHVASYRYHIGPVPDGHQVGHLCHDRDKTCQDWRKCTHRRCVNPDHLAAQTPSENMLARPYRQQLCRQGLHDLTKPGSFYESTNGWRTCRECHKSRQRELQRSKARLRVPLQRNANNYEQFAPADVSPNPE